MARVVIEIDGDASGAEAALGDVQSSLGDLDSASESAGGAVAGLNAKLVNAASAVGIARAGFELLRGGINMLWESTERYFTATEDGQQMWEDLERQGRALKGILFELFIGTSDQTEAFARMSAIMGDLVAGARGAMQILQPMANLLRGALSMGARAVALAFGEAGSMTGQFADQMDTASDELSRLQGLLDQQNDVVGQALTTLDHYGQTASHALTEVADTMAVVDGMEFDASGMTVGFDEATAQFQQNVADVLASATSLSDLDVPVSATFTDGTRVIGRGVDNLRESLDSIVIEVEGRQMTALEAWGSQLQVTTALLDAEAAAARNSASATSSASSATEEQSISAEEAAISVARLAVETGNATLQILEQKHALDLLNEALGQKADRDKIASEIAVSQLEQKRSLMEQEAEFERAILLKTEGLKEQLAEKEAARAARQKERVDLAKSGYQILTNSAVSMAAASIKSGKKSAEETRKMIGDELVALGAMGLAKSAMMLFEPGKQALAVGLGVASVAAMALGAKMGATAISGGGGVAAPAAGQSQSVTNVTFQNNFAQIGSRDQFLRVTGDAFQEAVDEGYIALPRGA